MSLRLLLLMFVPYCLAAQDKNTIRGKVLNGETGVAIQNASVFISNTSKGTITANDGSFVLENIPAGSYDLIISSIGFRTHAFAFSSSKLPINLEVRLEPKAAELDAVTVEPDEKDGWVKWGNFFLENFIGVTDASRHCVLKNNHVLRFKFSKRKNQLTVIADEPLIIENKALGYELQYQLENFFFDFNNRSLLFIGYPFFKDLTENRNNVPKRWLRNREKAYSGSIMHFIRSVYSNSLIEQGFEVRRLVKTPNYEKERVRTIYQSMVSGSERQKSTGINTLQVIKFHEDSSAYYQKVMQQPNLIETYGRHILTADSIVSVQSDQQKLIFFTDHLYITYKKAVEEKAYVENLWEKRKPFHRRSSVNLLEDTPVAIEANGNYMPPEVFFSSGYWAWSEKIAHLLPFEYVSSGSEAGED